MYVRTWHTIERFLLSLSILLRAGNSAWAMVSSPRNSFHSLTATAKLRTWARSVPFMRECNFSISLSPPFPFPMFDSLNLPPLFE